MSKSWRIYASRTLALEKRYTPLIISQIKSFRNQFISDLRDYGLNTAKSNLSIQAMDEGIAKTLQAIYKTAGLLGAKLQDSIRVKVPMKSKAGGFGRNETWIREVINYLKLHMLEMVSNITETMRDDILKILEKAVDEGLSIDQIVVELRRLDLIQSRARVIARTEINRASNVGHSVAAKTLPYETDKKWSAAKDHLTRHSHVFINGHIVDEDGFFEVPIYKGDKPTGMVDRMQYPGDASASAANTINCRCRVLYIPKRDSKGNLILRTRSTATIIQMPKPRTSIPQQQIAAVLKSHIEIGVE